MDATLNNFDAGARTEAPIDASRSVKPDAYVRPRPPKGFIRASNRNSLPQVTIGPYCYDDWTKGTKCFASQSECRLEFNHELDCHDFRSAWCAIMWSRPTSGGENAIVDCKDNETDCESRLAELVDNYANVQPPDLMQRVSFSEHCYSVNQ